MHRQTLAPAPAPAPALPLPSPSASAPALALALTLLAGCPDQVVPQQQPDQTVAPRGPQATYEGMFQKLGRASRSHQLADIVPFVSRRLRRELVQVMRKDRERFWRHMDRLSRGIQSGLTVGKPSRREDGRLQLPLRFGNDDGVSPIIIIEDGQPRIDRF